MLSPKQVRFLEENPNADFVGKIKRSRSRSENERKLMETEGHRTKFDGFLKKFKDEHVDKRN